VTEPDSETDSEIDVNVLRFQSPLPGDLEYCPGPTRTVIVVSVLPARARSP
jgi:hypothetical protein